MIQVVIESGVAELEVQRGENRVRIRRTAATNSEVILPAAAAPVVAGTPVAAPAAVPAPVAGSGGVSAGAGLALAPAADPALATVKSPIVGTFYESPSPDSPPFVRVGDVVKPGQVLCIIESMKLMNEIESEVSGAIVSKLVENGHPVEYGEALFLVRPA